MLIGGGGQDTFIGGAGNDTFVIDRVAPLVAAIRDFTSGSDRIGLMQNRFGNLFANGTLADSALGNGAAATTDAMRLYYNASQGALYYDADGVGAGAAVQIASFAASARPSALAVADFVLAG